MSNSKTVRRLDDFFVIRRTVLDRAFAQMKRFLQQVEADRMGKPLEANREQYYLGFDAAMKQAKLDLARAMDEVTHKYDASGSVNS